MPRLLRLSASRDYELHCNGLPFASLQAVSGQRHNQTQAGEAGEGVVNEQEKQWFAKLERLLLNPPEGHWLFAAGNTLHLMKYDSKGERVMNGSGMSAKAVVATARSKIAIDGGDW